MIENKDGKCIINLREKNNKIPEDILVKAQYIDPIDSKRYIEADYILGFINDLSNLRRNNNR